MYISIDYDKCYCSFECVPKAGSARLDSLISDQYFGLFNKYLITEIILQGYEKKIFKLSPYTSTSNTCE